jgi:hypothetical protein
MNHSLFTCDRATHLKIVAVALAAGIVVVLAGIHARMDDAGNTLASVRTSGPVVKAGSPQVYSTRSDSAIR